MEDMVNQKSFRILRSVEEERAGGEVICKRITSPYYINDNHTVGEIAGVFINNSSMQALGVTDFNGIAAGIVIRNELFALIGQKFGRELYFNRNVREVVTPAEMIYYKRNTFSVIDEYSEELKSKQNRYFLLVDSGNRFRGIISSFDLVLFLSEMMTRELKGARRVHSAIVMDEINISTGKFEAVGSTTMAGETGGDFQYIRNIGNNRWFLSLCDVSGKGLNAGLISVAVSSMYAVYDFSAGIHELIRRINSYIYSLFSGEMFLTGEFILLDEATGEIEIYDMGHSMMYIFNDGNVSSTVKQNNNMPLGIQKDIEPVMSGIKLEYGDILLSYTDGFPEQNNLLNENFGEQRILYLAAKYRNSGLRQIKEIIQEELKAWSSGNAQSDDMSLLLLRYKKAKSL